MKSAEELGKEPPKFEVIYTLKNSQTGETVKITDEQYLSDSKWYEQGTPWELQGELTESRMVSAGYTPPILDFVLYCEEGDLTDFYLEHEKVVFFVTPLDRKSTRLNSSHVAISYAVFCLKKK